MIHFIIKRLFLHLRLVKVNGLQEINRFLKSYLFLKSIFNFKQVLILKHTFFDRSLMSSFITQDELLRKKETTK